MTIMRGGSASQGTPIGILMADTLPPHIIGDVGNGFTYEFPVRFLTVRDATALRCAQRDAALEKRCVEAAQHLEQDGCQAVACGNSAFAMFESALSAAVHIPVISSALLQAPFAAQVISLSKKIAVLTDNPLLRPADCTGYGLTEDHVVIGHMAEHGAFYQAFWGEHDHYIYEDVKADVLNAICALVHENPNIGVIICEGASFTPFSADICRTTGLPVFDLVTLIRLVASGILRGMTDPFKNRLNGGVTSVPPAWGQRPQPETKEGAL